MGWLGHEDHILDGDDAVHDHEGVGGGPGAELGCQYSW